ncbi:hypothetical protein H9L10_11640 [Phycicoccus endophyticus]|uniref:Galactosyltransferase C-terminal domain-containing protein n=1 Tax=Phycicoccus endophyticus TaxID=1690220 RepID=A0A7G9QZZ1_9MICO|nr:galactosyltransferase-related protein [Phycicoccus endophyticus]NHI20775.1 hypothetical protein [Phycicoccus endophyticus]QNN48916.1 hypothetical protein H9L10_11640 [Phycicoccus endophyticus]GGL43845.1 glycosyl transferase family A [Phycicoccus endophyticus]
MSEPRVAVVTIVHGRHRHLLGQRWGLARQSRAPEEHVVVAMDDPGVREVLAGSPGPPAHVLDVPAPGGRLPLAGARNAGVEAAVGRGAQVVVLLDVDCIPGQDLVARYTGVLAGRVGGSPRGPAVACGIVRYLDAATTALPEAERTWHRLERGSSLHPARAAPPPGAVRPGQDTRLFWSLSFATTATDWAVLGGFDDGYVGYGGEDTDFGQRVSAAGGTILWLGDAAAYHQHHGAGGLPVQHVHDIVDNGARFAGRWGWWPMRGWLDAFEDLGLVESDGAGGYVVTSRARGLRVGTDA